MKKILNLYCRQYIDGTKILLVRWSGWKKRTKTAKIQECETVIMHHNFLFTNSELISKCSDLFCDIWCFVATLTPLLTRLHRASIFRVVSPSAVEWTETDILYLPMISCCLSFCSGSRHFCVFTDMRQIFNTSF